MTSRQQNHPVPHINPPTSFTPSPPETSRRNNSKPEPGYFTSRSNSSRAVSPNEFVRPATTPPTQLLRTPPTSADSQSRQDGNYFSSRMVSSSPRQMITTTPSDTLSTPSCFSPSVSTGGSLHSRSNGLSTCSGSSGGGGLLTPPQFPTIYEKAPYRPRRGSSGSLTMTRRSLRRATTDPNDEIPRRRRRRRGHRCRHRRYKSEKYESGSLWRLPGCQLAPTAPPGQRLLCRDHVGRYNLKQTKFGNTDTYGRLPYDPEPDPTPLLFTRRWSSVEIGAHQVHLKPTLTLSPKTTTPSPLLPTNLNDIDVFAPKSVIKRHRSSNFARGANDNDIVSTVREQLKERKVPPVETPASITLRRASDGSNTTAKNVHSDITSGGSTPIASQSNLHERSPSAAYLITERDIETITEIIEANLRRRFERNPHKIPETLSGVIPGTRTQSQSNFISEGLLPTHSIASGFNGCQGDTEESNCKGSMSWDHLQVSPPVKKKKDTVSRSPSQKSVHEVIWKGEETPVSSSSITEEDESNPHSKNSPLDESSPEMNTKHGSQPQSTPNSGQQSNAFDPNNARASINEWSLQTLQNEISVVVTSSDSDSNETPRVYRSKIDERVLSDYKGIDNQPQETVKPQMSQSRLGARPPLVSTVSSPKERMITKSRPHPRPTASEANLHGAAAALEDVVSFPPLPPRKATCDWFSPLPAIETSPPLANSRSLYDIGLDANVAPGSPPRSVTPKPTQTSWVRSAEISPARSLEFDPQYEVRRKSTVRTHPKAVARTGSPSTMGSSIGVHSQDRRKSSTPRVNRVRTIDNIHKGEHDTPPSRWRPPSICPAPRTPSPSEEEGRDERTPRPLTPTQRSRSGFFDRIALLQEKSPPSPKVDCVGIYGSITGARGSGNDGLFRANDSKPHVCDDCAVDPRTPSIDWIG